MKWQLLRKVLPLTALFTLAKVAIHRLGWEPWAFDSLTGALFGAATFVIAFILSGTLADYNNSEDMAIQIVNAIESIEDGNQLAAFHHPEYNPEPLRQGLREVLQSILGWLKARRPQEEVKQALNKLNPLFAEVTKFSLPPVVNRLQLEQGKIRLLVTRIQVNRDTNFLEPAYALLEIFLVGAVIALLLIKSDLFSETLVVSIFLFTSFTYLLLLVKDLDNPFQYDGSSCVDVDLSRLEEKCDRLKSTTIPQG